MTPSTRNSLAFSGIFSLSCEQKDGMCVSVHTRSGILNGFFTASYVFQMEVAVDDVSPLIILIDNSYINIISIWYSKYYILNIIY